MRPTYNSGFGFALILYVLLLSSSGRAQVAGPGMHPRQPLPPGYQPRPLPQFSRSSPPAPAPQASVPVVAPSVADTPLTLIQQPTSPPQVTFRNGELTIAAQNSTLAEILRAVRTQTGATIDIPSNATERVVTNLGPGPAQQVLASLLNGTRYNYVLEGSASNPDELDHVILMTRNGSEVASVQPSSAAPPPQSASNGEETQGLDMQEAEAPADDIPGPDAQPSPEQAQSQDQNNDQATPFTPGQPPGVRSPQQLLQDLQQRQQQNGNQGFFPGTPVQAPQPEQ